MRLRLENYWQYNRGDDWRFVALQLRWFSDEFTVLRLTLFNWTLAIIIRSVHA